MKRTIALLLAAAMAVLLCGCSCKHEWVDATCETPKTCALCGQTEGDILPHSWTDATCTSPKSCALCGAAEGEAVPHSYSSWEAGGETMSRSCQACGFQESMPVDREILLSSLLMGRWNCTKLILTSLDMDLDAADEFKGPIPHMVIGENNSLRFFNGGDYFDGTFQFAEYKVEDGKECYYFNGMQDGVAQMLFQLEISPEQEAAIYGYERNYVLRYEPESQGEAAMRESLTGTWVSTPERADGSKADYRDCTITFQDNLGFAITIDGAAYEGNWSEPDLHETEEYTLYSCLIQYDAENRRNRHFVHLIHYREGGVQCSINFANEFELYFKKQ